MVPPDPFRRLFDDEAGYVLSRLRWLGVPDRDRLDVAQMVFLNVARHLGELDPARPVRPWLLAIACNRARDYFKRRARHEQLEGLDPDTITAPEARTVDQLDAARTVRRCLASLSYEHREALVLVVLEEHTVREAAEMLGVTEGALESRLGRAREALAAAVARLRAAERQRLGEAAGAMPLMLSVDELLRGARDVEEEDLAGEVEQLRARLERALPLSRPAPTPMGAWIGLVMITAVVVVGAGDGSARSCEVIATDLADAKREARNETAGVPPSTPPSSSVPASLSASSAETPATSKTSRRMPPAASSPAPATSTHHPSPTEGELLALARLALREGDRRRALGFLRQHEAVYPAGVLRPERVALLAQIAGPR